MRINQLTRTITLVLLPLFAFAQPKNISFDLVDYSVDTLLDDQISAFQIVEIDVAAAHTAWKSTAGNLELLLSGSAGDLSLNLTPWELRKQGYQMNVPGHDRLGSVTTNHSPVYRGNVSGGGEVIFTIDRQFVLGHWEKDGRRMALEPLWRMVEGAPRNLYVLYDEANALATGPEACATDVSNWQPDNHSHDPLEKAAGDCLEVDLALVADTEMFQDFDNPQNPNETEQDVITSVENFMLGVLADVRTLYDDEFEDEIQLFVSSTVIYTIANQDPYTNNTDAETLLDDFRIFTNQNPGSIPGEYDLANLWTGRNFAGGTVGIAYLGGICNTAIRFNCLENFTSSSIQLRNMWAHEIGHNFDSPHDASGSQFIMAPRVNSFSSWSSASINTIQNFYNSVNCLASCIDPVAPTPVIELVYPGIVAGSHTYFFDLSTGRPTSREWTFTGGTPATSSDESPEVFYQNPGVYTATLSVTNEFGTSTSSVPVRVQSAGATKVLLREDFEDEEYRVEFFNPGNNELAWQIAFTEGNLGGRAAVADNGSLDGRGTSDFIRTPPINLDEVTQPEITLEYAYVRWNAFFRDQLRVSVIQNGVKSEVFFGDENGSGNHATGEDQASNGGGLFIPEAETDWCEFSPGCITIDLSSFQGNGPVEIEIENDAGFGQPLYVDNFTVLGIGLSALPVEWLAFTAKATDKAVELDWMVNQTEDHAGFTVERSSASQNNWSAITTVPASGGASQSVEYGFEDRDVLPGTTYNYRVRQYDLDGTESVSQIRTVQLDGANEAIAAYPNPAQEQVFVTGSDQPLAYTLFNAVGQRMLIGQIPTGGGEIDLSSLAPGVYLLRTELGKLRLVKR